MRITLTLAILLVIYLISSWPTANASGSIRCGNKLILQGEIRDTVRQLCGDPDDIVKNTIWRRPSYVRNGRVIYFGDNFVEAQVETWIYNFGPNKLMQRLRFVDGVVEDIESLGYGHNKK